jgi:hypothetical protein
VTTLTDAAVRAMLYLRVQMSLYGYCAHVLYGYCPHVLSDLGEIQNERDEHNAKVHSPSIEISVGADLTFLMSTNYITCMCVLCNCAAFESNRHCGEVCVLHHHTVHICSLVTIHCNLPLSIIFFYVVL